MNWEPKEFLVADYTAAHEVSGYVYRGLGLHQLWPASPKGRSPPIWTLTHLGTGHAICSLRGNLATAFPVASEIADAGEWDFDSLVGWKDRDPELKDRVKAILVRYEKMVIFGGGSHNEEVARAIATARA